MSKNFYGKKILKAEDKIELLKLVFDEKLEILNEKLKDFNHLHLGQSANSWKFLFQWNDGKYYTNKLEFLNFIETLDIVDEYKTPYTAGEFWSYTQDVDWNGVAPKSRILNHSVWHYSEYIVVDDMEFLNCEFS